ncbi:hypothetical protein FRX31_004642 [Thalictrum thalictroides]|uniref:Uncharacterized protein n=1 Tax=Thalictrum thalictroides TaxID=46969 RepID=A0A7J6XBE7_THATH|nr:hypothetical protein FRX31_004642 [Thalictrum thalictroides]
MVGIEGMDVGMVGKAMEGRGGRVTCGPVGMVVGMVGIEIEGIGGSVTFEMVGIVGIGRDGMGGSVTAGTVGMVGNVGFGKVGIGKVGIVGNGGNVGIGRVGTTGKAGAGGVSRRWRAAWLILMLKNDNATKKKAMNCLHEAMVYCEPEAFKLL